VAWLLRLLRLPSNLGFLPRSRRQPHPVRRMRRPRRPVRSLRPGSRLISLCSRARPLRLSLEPQLGHSRALRPVPALPRLQVWQPQPPRRSVVRSRQADSLAQPRDPAAQTSPLAVHPPPRAEYLLRQSPPRPARKPVCPPRRPLLPRGCQGRRCSPRLRFQSLHRARIRTLQETSALAQVRKSERLKPTIWRSPK
jgi:hypothetical protein